MHNIKCPICNQFTLGKIESSNGTAHFLSTVDEETNPPAIYPASGIAVHVYGCTSCGTMLLKNIQLIK